MAGNNGEQKLVRELSRLLPGHELHAERTKGNHFKVWITGHPFVTVSGSPSDYWAIRHILGDLRRSLATPARGV